jgi:hypothetical protein
MRNDHIDGVEILSATDDAGKIAQARKLFESRCRTLQTDGFEVWDGARFVYRFPEAGPKPS